MSAKDSHVKKNKFSRTTQEVSQTLKSLKEISHLLLFKNPFTRKAFDVEKENVLFLTHTQPTKRSVVKIPREGGTFIGFRSTFRGNFYTLTTKSPTDSSNENRPRQRNSLPEKVYLSKAVVISDTINMHIFPLQQRS